MKNNSKEFEELRQQFERDIKQMPIYLGTEVVRDRESKHHFYTNGKVNDLFLSYMTGYQLAKSMARTEALNLDEDE